MSLPPPTLPPPSTPERAPIEPPRAKTVEFAKPDPVDPNRTGLNRYVLPTPASKLDDLATPVAQLRQHQDNVTRQRRNPPREVKRGK